MKRYLIASKMLIVFIISACAQSLPEPPPTPSEILPTATEVIEIGDFIKVFGGNRRDRGINLIETAEDGYAIVGYTSSYEAKREDVYLIKTDKNGELLWEMTYGGAGDDNGWDLLEMDDGGFMISGFTNSTGAGGFDFYLIRTDRDGNLLWEQTYGGPEDDLAWSMSHTADGKVAIAGQTESYGEGDKDGYLILVDRDGNLITSNTYGSTGEDRLYSIDLAPDGGFVLTGTTTSFGAGGRNAYLVKTDSAAVEDWVGVYGEDPDDVAHAVRITSDGSLILTGYTKSFGSANYDSWSILVDGNGEVIWQKFFGGSNDDRTIYGEQTDDGGFIQVGYTRSFDAIGWDVFIVKLDSKGEVLWHEVIGERSDDTGYTIIQDGDGSFVLTGESYSYRQGGGDLLLIKLSRE